MGFRKNKIRYEIRVVGIDKRHPSGLHSYSSYEKCREALIKLYIHRREAALYDNKEKIGEVWYNETKGWNWYIENDFNSLNEIENNF